VVIAAAAANCRSDPAEDKREFLRRGKEYAAKKQYFEAVIEFQRALKADPQLGEAEAALGDAFYEIGDYAHAAAAFSRAADLLPDDIEIQLKAGNLRLLSGSYEDARGLSERVLAKQPVNTAAMLLRANALAGLSDIGAAADLIEDAIALEPNRAELYTNLASIRSASGKSGEAEATFKKAIELAPGEPRVHAGLGRFYWQAQRFPEAEQAFLKAVTLDPSYALGNRFLATFYVSTGRPAQAEPYLKAVADLLKDVESDLRLADYYLLYGKRDEGMKRLLELQKRPEAASRATVRMAAAEYAAGNKEQAHALLKGLLKESSDDALAHQLSAQFFFSENNLDEAFQAAQKALQADPRLDSAHFILARVHLVRGMIPEAIVELKQVVQRNQYAASAQMMLAKLQSESGYHDQALVLAGAAVRASGATPEMRLALVRMLFSKGDLARADSELAGLKKECPQAPNVLAAVGDLHLLRREFAPARAAFDRALGLDPTSLDGLKGRLAVDLFTGNTGAVRQRLESELARTPDRLGLLLLAARTYGALRDLPKAEASMKKAIAGNPSSLEAYGMLGQLYYQQGRLDEGRKEYETVVQQQPRNTAALTMLGLIAKEAGRVDDAIRLYEKVLEIDSEAGVAANNLAWIFAEQNRQLDRAIELATIATRRMPSDPNVADTLGWVLVRRGFPALALPHLLKIVGQYPQDPEFRYHLGAAYAELRETAKARTEVEQALKLSRSFNGARDAELLLTKLK
jgi:tetratricopeptide (TPR) repeat protein